MGLKFPNWLPIAISFNNFSHCRITIWKDAEMFAAYAICTRIIASAYTLELREARRRMSSILAVVKEVKDGIESKSLAIGDRCHRRHCASHRKEDEERKTVCGQLRALRGRMCKLDRGFAILQPFRFLSARSLPRYDSRHGSRERIENLSIDVVRLYRRRIQVKVQSQNRTS